MDISLRAGHDANYLAVSGLLSTFVPDQDINIEMKPVYPGNIVADYCAGSLATVALTLEALLKRKMGHEGRIVVDSSLGHNLVYYN